MKRSIGGEERRGRIKRNRTAGPSDIRSLEKQNVEGRLLNFLICFCIIQVNIECNYDVVEENKENILTAP